MNGKEAIAFSLGVVHMKSKRQIEDLKELSRIHPCTCENKMILPDGSRHDLDCALVDAFFNEIHMKRI